MRKLAKYGTDHVQRLFGLTKVNFSSKSNTPDDNDGGNNKEITSTTSTITMTENSERSTTRKRAPSPPPPELCCRQGCETCVWLQYCLDIVDYYQLKQGGSLELAEQELERHLIDPTWRSFVLMELRKIKSNSSK